MTAADPSQPIWDASLRSPFRGHSRGDVPVTSITVREPDLTLTPLLDHSSARTLGRSFARVDPAMQYQVARDDAGRPPALESARQSEHAVARIGDAVWAE